MWGGRWEAAIDARNWLTDGIPNPRRVPPEGGGPSSISIAHDTPQYAWTLAATSFLKEPLKDALGTVPNVHAWLERVGERPAVERGMALPRAR